MIHAFSHASLTVFISGLGQGSSSVEEAAVRETPQRTIMSAIAIHKNFRKEVRIEIHQILLRVGRSMSVAMSEKKFHVPLWGKPEMEKCFVSGIRCGVPGYATPFANFSAWPVMS